MSVVKRDLGYGVLWHSEVLMELEPRELGAMPAPARGITGAGRMGQGWAVSGR